MADAPPQDRPRLFLVDAYALIYRSHFAFVNRPLTNARGENTSAAWGVANFLLRIRDEHDPEYLAMVFDAGMSDRETLYPEYKATREKMPEELEAGLPRIRELVAAFRDPVVELDGYEADDVIGTLARKAGKAGIETVIVSGDKDFYQLIGPDVRLLNPGRGGPSGVSAEWVDEANAHERMGVPPERVVDYLALIGDSSDNVPGAPGIGPKTAVKLLDRYGSLDEVLAQRDEISGKRARTSLQEHHEQVELSRELVTIRRDLEVPLDLDALRVQEPDRPRLRQVLAELEFRTLIERFSDDDGPEAPGGGEVDYRAVTDVADVVGVVEAARDAGSVAVDVETTSLSPMEAELVGISLSWAPGTGVYLPLAHVAPPADLLDDPDAPSAPPNLPPLQDESMAPLRALLEDPEVPKSGQNLKYDLLVLRRAGVELAGIEFDTMVASYVLDPGRRSHGLDALSTDLLGYVPISYEDVAGKGRKQVSFAEVPLEEAVPYACEDADLVLRLRAVLEPRLAEEGLDDLFRSLEQPLILVLAAMEENGIRIDPRVFREMGERLAGELEALREDIWSEAGGEFNINSTPQLREVLFDRLELPVVKRTKTGPSTDASVLEQLAADGHTLPGRLLEYRQLEKLRSTYVEALPRLVNPGTGRIHASFNQTVAATGRLSSSDPNLQNIPIRTALGREVRRGFVPEEGSLFLAADYSQIELRILAHVSGDEAFVHAFRKDRDVHRQTAAVIFDVEVEAVTAEQRARAKTINFATLYGQGAFSLARDLGMTREEAQGFIDRYFERFSGVRRFLDEQVEQAREKGWVATLSGRRRKVPELESRNWNVRQFGERVAQNTPIQGTAADLIKQAMLGIHEGMGAVAPGARMLVQVHDELVFEAPEAEMDALEAFVVETMESAMSLDVPLRVDTGRGRSWYECK